MFFFASFQIKMIHFASYFLVAQTIGKLIRAKAISNRAKFIGQTRSVKNKFNFSKKSERVKLLFNQIVKLDYEVFLKIMQCPATKSDSFVHKLRDLYLNETDFCAKVFFVKTWLNFLTRK